MKMTRLPWMEKMWKLMTVILLSSQEVSRGFSTKRDLEEEDLAIQILINSTMQETKEDMRPTKSKVTNAMNAANLDTT